MRALPLLLLALVGLATLPTAAAATFDLGASKIVERALDPGEPAVFEMPLTVNQDGFLYSKVLPTPGNAVNDGSKANGSLADRSGWWVSFAMVKGDGTRVEMGEYVDSTVSTLVPVSLGETPTLVMTVNVPEDAARGGPQQRVYVAIAYRVNDGTNSGTNSGGVIDEARALTLLLSNALLPPAEQQAALEVPGTGAGEDAGDGADGEAGSGSGSGSGSGTGAGSDAGDDGGPQESSEVPPVTGIQTPYVQVHVAALPTWFLAGALLLGTALVAVLALVALALFALAKQRRSEERPVAPAREVPVLGAHPSAPPATRIERASAREE